MEMILCALLIRKFVVLGRLCGMLSVGMSRLSSNLGW